MCGPCPPPPPPIKLVSALGIARVTQSHELNEGGSHDPGSGDTEQTSIFQACDSVHDEFRCRTERLQRTAPPPARWRRGSVQGAAFDWESRRPVLPRAASSVVLGRKVCFGDVQ